MRTPEQKLETKLRKAAERKAYRDRVMKKHPPSVRYAKSKFTKGKARQTKAKAVKVPNK